MSGLAIRVIYCLWAFFNLGKGQMCENDYPLLDTSSNGVGGVLTVSCILRGDSFGYRSGIFYDNPVSINTVLNPPAVLNIRLNITGVTAAETRVHANDSCLKSIITFTGNVALLNNVNITCIHGGDGKKDTGTIHVATVPEVTILKTSFDRQCPLFTCTTQWSEPLNGGNNLTAYYITVADTNGTDIQVKLPPNATSYSHHIKYEGNYSFSIVSENQVGNSSASVAVLCLANKNFIHQPTIVKACIQDNTVSILWIAEEPLIMNYIVSYNNYTLSSSKDSRSVNITVMANLTHYVTLAANVCGSMLLSTDTIVLKKDLLQPMTLEKMCYSVIENGSLVQDTVSLTSTSAVVTITPFASLGTITPLPSVICSDYPGLETLLSTNVSCTDLFIILVITCGIVIIFVIIGLPIIVLCCVLNCKKKGSYCFRKKHKISLFEEHSTSVTVSELSANGHRSHLLYTTSDASTSNGGSNYYQTSTVCKPEASLEQTAPTENTTYTELLFNAPTRQVPQYLREEPVLYSTIVPNNTLV